MAKDNSDKSAAKVEEAEQVDDGLVEMRKGAEVSRVHPTCVKSHVAAGWAE